MKFILSSLSGKVKEKEVWIYRVDQILKLVVEFGEIIVAEPKMSFFSKSDEHPTLMIYDDDI